MSPLRAYAWLLGLVATSFWIVGWPGIFDGAPATALLVTSIIALGVMRRRTAFAVVAGTTLAINAVLMAAVMGPATWHVAGVAFSERGLQVGATAGLRLVALLGINLAAMQRWPPARLLDALHLPPTPTAFLAAVLLAAQDIGRDFDRMVAAARSEGRWPTSRWQRARAMARLLPNLMVAADRSARHRWEALHLAGITMGPRFAPIVAVTALAIAGRLALVALPNVALTFAIVFVAGIAYGGRVAAWGALWAMALSNLMLSGFYLPSFVNVPAMMLVALLGGLLADLDWHGASRLDRVAGHLFAAITGIVATLAFSVISDTLTWALIAENRASLPRLQVGIVAGLTFNIVPAIVNGVLFTAAVAPVARAFQALRLQTPRDKANAAAASAVAH